jgi:hypothetical protein
MSDFYRCFAAPSMVCKGQSRKQECRSVPISFLFLIVRVIAKKQYAAFRDIDPSWDVS